MSRMKYPHGTNRPSLTPEQIVAAVTAIRADKEVGKGTCSVQDEAYTDSELADWVQQEHQYSPMVSPLEAVSRARSVNKLHWEMAKERGEW